MFGKKVLFLDLKGRAYTAQEFQADARLVKSLFTRTIWVAKTDIGPLISRTPDVEAERWCYRTPSGVWACTERPPEAILGVSGGPWVRYDSAQTWEEEVLDNWPKEEYSKHGICTKCGAYAAINCSFGDCPYRGGKL